jgi:hypothetical protein
MVARSSGPVSERQAAQPGPTRPKEREDEQQDVLHARQGMAAPEQAGPVQLLALQRRVGNQAASMAIQRRGKGKKAQDPFELGANTSENTGGSLTAIGGGVDSKTFDVAPKVPTAQETASKDPLAFDKGGNAPEPLNANDPGVQMGFAGSSFGTLQGTLGTVGGSVAVHRARVERKKAVLGGHKAGVRLQDRAIRMGGGDIGKGIATTGSGVSDLTAKGLAVTQAGTTAAGTAGIVAGGFAAPLALFNMLRDARKTAKAWNRCLELEKTFQSWDEPRATIEKMQEQFDEAEAGRVEAETAHAETKTAKAKAEQAVIDDTAAITGWENEIAALSAPTTPVTGFKAKMAAAGTAIKNKATIAALRIKIAERKLEKRYHESQVVSLTEKMASLEKEVRDAVQVKTDCLARIETSKPLYEKMKAVVGSTGEQAVKEQTKQAKGGNVGVSEPSLLEIQAYAYEKNHAGRIKKLISTIGGALATGGAAASLAVGIAAVVGTASAVAMATPVGWALAGTAAAIALGLGLYKGFKWLRKRWGLAETNAVTGQKRTFGQRLGKTLAVWTPAGVSRREQYAKRLLDMALGDKCYTEQKLEAQKLIKNLIGGKGWDDLGMTALELTTPSMPTTTPTTFTPTEGPTGSSTGLASGATAHEGIDTKGDTTGATKGATQALTAAQRQNKNYKAAHELLIAKFAS